ncbi:heterodisulfide reductase-related iron-sulfur binding cluster [Streptomyces scabiei]|uniref:(Fe-S)-binding protein n=1 Tax=Streptomyces scabiei TaxID=1930 RepID=UPI00298FE938|nr:heterodisulfide reductase-related iron-sulfur binding cluster [Streptomyces scabiei]MDW8803394.1 heterodisulfide reductase-related iron-sulfur binding cluster [Streptomyces scabiei]
MVLNSFDETNPPRRELLDDCVHCGFCLPSCPTYLLDGNEADSPRGRIHLMDLADRGEVPLDATFAQHIDGCLGCMACVVACPSGVEYGRLLEAARPQIERNVPRPPADALFRRMIFSLFPHPNRLRVVTVIGLLYQRIGLQRLLRRLLPPRLRALDGLLPPVRLRALLSRSPDFVPARTERRLRVALLTGCAQRVYFGHVNAATIRVLAAEGCDVVIPRGQPCCGALSMHAGLVDDAARRARRTIDALGSLDVDAVVVNVAGCGSTLKEYGDLLRDDPAYAERAESFSAKVRDVHELLMSLPPMAPREPLPLRVVYHDACHLANAQRVTSEPRQLLNSIPDLTLVEVAEPDICCGSAGIYNLVQPEPAERLGRRKAESLLAGRPDVIATGNAGCLLQIRRHSGDADVPVVHPVELLDASLGGPTSILPTARPAPDGRA